jgi:hypothetical protein
MSEMSDAMSDRPNTPRQVNDKFARLGYLPCDVCGEPIDWWWMGMEQGEPLIVSSRAWDTPSIGMRCDKHPFPQAGQE